MPIEKVPSIPSKTPLAVPFPFDIRPRPGVARVARDEITRGRQGVVDVCKYLAGIIEEGINRIFIVEPIVGKVRLIPIPP